MINKYKLKKMSKQVLENIEAEYSKDAIVLNEKTENKENQNLTSESCIKTEVEQDDNNTIDALKERIKDLENKIQEKVSAKNTDTLYFSTLNPFYNKITQQFNNLSNQELRLHVPSRFPNSLTTSGIRFNFKLDKAEVMRSKSVPEKSHSQLNNEDSIELLKERIIELEEILEKQYRFKEISLENNKEDFDEIRSEQINSCPPSYAPFANTLNSKKLGLQTTQLPADEFVFFPTNGRHVENLPNSVHISPFMIDQIAMQPEIRTTNFCCFVCRKDICLSNMIPIIIIISFGVVFIGFILLLLYA